MRSDGTHEHSERLVVDEPGERETRLRLLESAGEVFAEHGFEGATVREIVTRAGANIASVNYHFGDKLALYRAVLKHFADLGLKTYPPDMGLSPDAPAPDRLHAFVHSFYLRIFAEGRPAYLSRLMLREMTQPTPALDERVREFMLPMIGRLQRIVRDVVGRELTGREAFHVCTSIIGQIVIHRQCNAVVSRLFPDETHYDRTSLDQLARHVTEFTLAGLNRLTRSEGVQR